MGFLLADVDIRAARRQRMPIKQRFSTTRRGSASGRRSPILLQRAQAHRAHGGRHPGGLPADGHLDIAAGH